MLRVESVLRRSGERATPSRASFHDRDLHVDSGRHLPLAGRRLNLTVREFDLLCFLIANPGVAYSRDQLLQEV